VSRRPGLAARLCTSLVALLLIPACATIAPGTGADGDAVRAPAVDIVEPLEPDLRDRLARAAVLVTTMPPVNAGRWQPPEPYHEPEPPGLGDLFYSPLGFVIVLPLIPVIAAVLLYEDLSDRPAEHFSPLEDVDLVAAFIESLRNGDPHADLPAPTICAPNVGLVTCHRAVASTATALIRVYLQAQYVGTSKQLPDGALAISMASQVFRIQDLTLEAQHYQNHWRWRVPVPKPTRSESERVDALQHVVDEGLRLLGRTLLEDLWRRDQPVALPAAVVGQLPAQQIFNQPPGSVVPAEVRPLWLTVRE
jgi:hypothetical protein